MWNTLGNTNVWPSVDRAWNASVPTALVEGRYFSGAAGAITGGRTYDVSPDGRRFVMVKEGGADLTAALPPQIVVVQPWFEELKRLVGN